MIKKAKELIKRNISNLRHYMMSVHSVVSAKAHEVADGTKAEAYVDTGVKILIAVVIGALLLGLLYTLFNTTIMPKVTQKITDLFSYAG